MRSITTKLIIAFLGVSLISIFMVAVLVRWNTSQEFNDFVFQRNSSEMVTLLMNYYHMQGSWQGVEPTIIMQSLNPADNPGGRKPPAFTLADEYGMVVVEGPGYSLGEIVPPEYLELGTPISVDGKVVGTLLVGREAFQVNAMETSFIHRIGSFLLTVGFSVAGLALILGILLAYNITRPIHQLTQVTREISQGTLGGQVDVRGRDEIGRLSESFNKMSADLARSNQVRKQMTADIAHELRTPLSLIIGQAEAVHDGVLPPTLENFEIIREGAGRLERLVDDLRILSLADAGELTLALQPLDPAKLVREVASMYRSFMQERQITLDVQLEPDLPRISIDPGRMTQVLGNIIDNAIRFTPQDGKILLSAGRVGDQVELSVQDNGRGVTPDELSRIFDRLYRADASRQNDHAGMGSGLGLAIARSIVEMHAGQIQASIPDGGGLRISILLPAA
jgi:two-component system, OmpR family, sensor histidine kinase BaeS